MIVKRLGYVEGGEKARCFRNADLFIAPSRWESFGLTVVEAMAWGLPVVAAGSDGVRGVLPDDWEWMAEPGDVDGLAGRLSMACGALHAGQGVRIGDRLRQEFLDKFLVERFREKVRAALRDACGD